MNAYMSYVKVFPTSETRIFHLYNRKYVSEKVGGVWYSYINGHGYKESYYRVDYLILRKTRNDCLCYIQNFEFFKSLRLAKQFAKKKHAEYINKLNELFIEKYGE